MTSRQLQVQAYTEWNRSPDIQRKYHTFDFYWSERYARIYRLPIRVNPLVRMVH
jgi:hypothetical protein